MIRIFAVLPLKLTVLNRWVNMSDKLSVFISYIMNGDSGHEPISDHSDFKKIIMQDLPLIIYYFFEN